MGKMINGLLGGTTSCAVALLCLTPVYAAEPDKDAAPAAPEAARSDAAAPDKSKDATKPDEAPPPEAGASAAAPPSAGEVKSGVKMKELLAED
jgi:hypothetical protein